jgi:hypothetical protein
MNAIRSWAVFDVFLGNPVLVERCATRKTLCVWRLCAGPQVAERSMSWSSFFLAVR